MFLLRYNSPFSSGFGIFTQLCNYSHHQLIPEPLPSLQKEPLPVSSPAHSPPPHRPCQPPLLPSERSHASQPPCAHPSPAALVLAKGSLPKPQWGHSLPSLRALHSFHLTQELGSHSHLGLQSPAHSEPCYLWPRILPLSLKLPLLWPSGALRPASRPGRPQGRPFSLEHSSSIIHPAFPAPELCSPLSSP